MGHWAEADSAPDPGSSHSCLPLRSKEFLHESQPFRCFTIAGQSVELLPRAHDTTVVWQVGDGCHPLARTNRVLHLICTCMLTSEQHQCSTANPSNQAAILNVQRSSIASISNDHSDCVEILSPVSLILVGAVSIQGCRQPTDACALLQGTGSSGGELAASSTYFFTHQLHEIAEFRAAFAASGVAGRDQSMHAAVQQPTDLLGPTTPAIAKSPRPTTITDSAPSDGLNCCYYHAYLPYCPYLLNMHAWVILTGSR